MGTHRPEAFPMSPMSKKPTKRQILVGALFVLPFLPGYLMGVVMDNIRECLKPPAFQNWGR